MANEVAKVDDLNSLNTDYSPEMEGIDSVINDIDTLYTESKATLDEIKKARARGSLTFIANQTSNLISLKTAKLQALKERVNIKNTKFNQEIKRLTGNLLNDDGDIPVTKLMELFSKYNVDYKTVNRKVNAVDAEIVDSDFDAKIDAALGDENEPITTDERELEIMKRNMLNVPDAEAKKEFEAQTDAYQVVSDINGEISIIDLVSSTDTEVVLIDKSVLGILPEEKADISSNENGVPQAIFRGVELEIVDFEE